MPTSVTAAPPPASDAPERHAPPGFCTRLAALVHAHRGRLLAYARRRGLDADESLDLVQDSFVAFLNLPEAPRAMAQPGDDALKLLTVILRHNLQNHRRKRSRRSRAQAELAAVAAPSAQTETSEALIARAEELARVRGCILRMAWLQRQVVMLSLLDERPREQVAELLGITDGHVRVLLHRAREHVRNCPYDAPGASAAELADLPA